MHAHRLMNCNPIPKLTIVLIWRTPACLKFGKTSNHAVENLPQRKQQMMHALSPTELPCVFIWVVRGAMPSGKRERSALWLNAMYSGKKWWIREFVPPYIFPLNSDYVAVRSLRLLRSNDDDDDNLKYWGDSIYYLLTESEVLTRKSQTEDCIDCAIARSIKAKSEISL